MLKLKIRNYILLCSFFIVNFYLLWYYIKQIYIHLGDAMSKKNINNKKKDLIKLKELKVELENQIEQYKNDKKEKLKEIIINISK